MESGPKRGALSGRRRTAIMSAALLAALCAIAAGAGAEPVKIGVLHSTGSSPVFIAVEKGYFAAAGLEPEMLFFASAQPVAVATAAGNVDIGYTGLTGGLYSLAAQGVLRIVGGGPHENPGFHNQPFLASNHAYEAGLRSFRDFPGHSVALSQFGSPPHYTLSLLAAKYGFDLGSLRLLPLQSLPNVVSAVVGGQADIAIMPGNMAVPLIQRDEVKLLGWVGDETPDQLAVTFAAAKTANERRDMVERCLGALRKASRDYYEAFTAADGTRKDGPTAPAILAMIAKYTGQSAEQVRLGLPYMDPEARLDVKDILRQVEWYRSQGMLKAAVDRDQLIDKRYVVALPEG